MPGPQHVLDRRAQMMAARIQQQAEMLARSLRPPNSAPFGTQALPERQAMEWWDANIDNEYGQRELKRYGPLDQMDLRRNLERYRAAKPPEEEAPLA